MTRAAPDNERFLSRWSRLKRAQVQSTDGLRSGETKPAGKQPGDSASNVGAGNSAAVASPAVVAATVASVAGTPAAGKSAGTADTVTAAGSSDSNATPALPAIDSLTMDSDFAQFFQPKVPESLRRAAVKKLFADPHFNIMDGLDTYIGDYTKSDPIPPEMLAQMWNLADIIDHPSNRKDAEAEAGTRMSAIDDVPNGTESAIQEQAVASAPTRRPREDGDPATFDGVHSDASEEAGTASKSRRVPACAETKEDEETPSTDKPAHSSA